MDSEKLIVITGGAGFIGSCVVKYLNEKGNRRIAIVDNLEKTTKWKNLVGKNFEEIISIEKTFDWLKSRSSEIRGIIHLGACSDTTEKDADYLLHNNFHHSVKLAQFALKNHIRFIYASSAATYGAGDQDFLDDHRFLENLKPQNMYGFSKHLFDLWALRENVLDQIVGLKYFNVYGPNELHKGKMASAITRMVPTIRSGAPIQLFRSNHPQFADGEQKRDFIYVKNVAEMTYHLLDLPIGGIFNIGSGTASSWNQLATAVFKALKIEPKIEYIPMPEEIVGYQNYTCANMEKTKQALGHHYYITPLEEAVQEYVCEYLLPEKTW